MRCEEDLERLYCVVAFLERYERGLALGRGILKVYQVLSIQRRILRLLGKRILSRRRGLLRGNILKLLLLGKRILNLSINTRDSSLSQPERA